MTKIEELPKNMHWIQDPAGTVFNLQQRETKLQCINMAKLFD